MGATRVIGVPGGTLKALGRKVVGNGGFNNLARRRRRAPAAGGGVGQGRPGTGPGWGGDAGCRQVLAQLR